MTPEQVNIQAMVFGLAEGCATGVCFYGIRKRVKDIFWRMATECTG